MRWCGRAYDCFCADVEAWRFRFTNDSKWRSEDKRTAEMAGGMVKGKVPCPRSRTLVSDMVPTRHAIRRRGNQILTINTVSSSQRIAPENVQISMPRLGRRGTLKGSGVFYSRREEGVRRPSSSNASCWAGPTVRAYRYPGGNRFATYRGTVVRHHCNCHSTGRRSVSTWQSAKTTLIAWSCRSMQTRFTPRNEEEGQLPD